MFCVSWLCWVNELNLSLIFFLSLFLCNEKWFNREQTKIATIKDNIIFLLILCACLNVILFYFFALSKEATAANDGQARKNNCFQKASKDRKQKPNERRKNEKMETRFLIKCWHKIFADILRWKHITYICCGCSAFRCELKCNWNYSCE